jgi:hypothetical protein
MGLGSNTFLPPPHYTERVALMKRIISAVKRGNRLRLLALGVVVVGVLLATTGCLSKASGGGWMLSANGEDRATFGFHFDGPRDAARGSYHDHGTGVRFKFDGLIEYTRRGPPECLQFVGTYTSLDKTHPGSGTVDVVACDFGEPGTFDGLIIDVIDGPYTGYHNNQNISGGNIQGGKSQ